MIWFGALTVYLVGCAVTLGIMERFEPEHPSKGDDWALVFLWPVIVLAAGVVLGIFGLPFLVYWLIVRDAGGLGA